MRAIVFNQPGDASVLQMSEVAKPVPGADDVLIRVAAAGVNPADWKCREGMLLQYFAYAYPFILGFDLAGTVEQVGTNVTRFKRGDRVFGCSNVGVGQWGSYAQFACANANQLALLPKSLDFTAAAAIPTAGLTAWQALFDQAGLKARQTVLINGGAGGVGSYAIQFAKAAGIRVAATCSAGNRAYLQTLGCDCVIDYRSEDIGAAVRAWAPEGVDAVIDAVSHGTLPQALDLLRPGGTLVSIATLNGDGDIAGDMAAAAGRGMQKKFAVMNPTVGHVQYAQIAALLDTGKVRSPVLEVYPWEQVALAHDRVAAGHVRGKVVLSIEPALAD